jgi:hypothetical protein
MKGVDVIESIQLGEPVERHGVVIAPVFPRQTPQARYVTLDDALPLGLRVTEVDAAGRVPELAVLNPLDDDVLLYDGEELIGAKQNRILNVTVLITGDSETVIPVSCVEEGRWRARSLTFAPGRAAYPDLRRNKALALSAAPLARGVAQAAIWDSVREKERLHGSHSPTHAHDELFHARAGDLNGLRRAFPLHPGQAGALFALDSQISLDFVSRPDAFARLYPKLLDGYLLDALERLDGRAARGEALESFLREVESAPLSRGPSAGLGEDLRLREEQVVGSGLALNGELLQLCAFSTNGSSSAHAPIARPSRRARGTDQRREG